MKNSPLRWSVAFALVCLTMSCGSEGGCVSGPLCPGTDTPPQPQPPGAPTGVTLTVQGLAIRVTWTPGSGATSHRVTLVTPDEATRTQTVGATAVFADFTGLTPGATYTGQVFAINASGETASASAQATVKLLTGAIRVSLSTTGLDLDPDGYFIGLWDENFDALIDEFEVGTSGSVIYEELEPGNYGVTITEVAANCVNLFEQVQVVSVVAEETETIDEVVSPQHSGNSTAQIGGWRNTA